MQSLIASLRRSANRWAATETRLRCQRVGSVRHAVADAAQSLIDAVQGEQRTEAIETVSAELIPLCDALKFVARRGPRVLRPRRVGLRGRPAWLWGVHSRVDRVPRGVVLVIGTWNYPLLLPGVQVAQALAAGNAVLWKPAPGTEQATDRLAACFGDRGLPDGVLHVLPTDASEAQTAIDAGVDLVVLTGAASTGRAVLRQCAEHLTPAVLELGGCDALIVLPGADLIRTARAIRFGLCLNAGATCIGPRRLLVEASLAEPLTAELRRQWVELPEMNVHPAARQAVATAVGDALRQGGIDMFGQWNQQRFLQTGAMRPLIVDGGDPAWSMADADLFAPVASLIRVADWQQAVAICNASRLALAASVFGPPAQTQQVARRLQVGTVTVNDLIAPTADPRLPFGGRRDSGFGVTRGAEGLLEMTVPRVVAIRHGQTAPHLGQRQPGDEDILFSALRMMHARRWGDRFAAAARMMRAAAGTRRSEPKET